MKSKITFRITLARSGWQFDAPQGQPLLLSAAQSGITLPSSCRNGTCRTCLCRMTAGQVHYRMDWPGVSAQEKGEGYILPCVAYPDSDVTLENSAARRA